MQKSQPEKPPDLPSAIFNITREGFKEIQRSQLTLDQIFYMESLKYGIDLKGIVNGDKLISWRQSLIRKGLIDDSEEITISGDLLLGLVGSGLPFKGAMEERESKVASDFDIWWRKYPATDQFTIRGKLFPGKRSLRLQKENCRTLFEKIVNTGEFSGEDIIRATEFEIEAKKKASIKENQNNLAFLKNTHTYLNQKAFEGFVELSKTEEISHQTNEDI